MTIRRPFLWLLFAGCGTTIHSVALRAPPHQLERNSASDVEVFMAARPTRPFVEILAFDAQQTGIFSFDNTSAAVLEKLRAEAGNEGCDALVVLGPNDSVVDGAAKHSVQTLKGWNASCIVYTDAED